MVQSYNIIIILTQPFALQFNSLLQWEFTRSNTIIKHYITWFRPCFAWTISYIFGIPKIIYGTFISVTEKRQSRLADSECTSFYHYLIIIYYLCFYQSNACQSVARCSKFQGYEDFIRAHQTGKRNSPSQTHFIFCTATIYIHMTQ